MAVLLIVIFALVLAYRRRKQRKVLSSVDSLTGTSMKKTVQRFKVHANEVTIQKEIGRGTNACTSSSNCEFSYVSTRFFYIGAFGVVYLARWRSAQVVVKKIIQGSILFLLAASSSFTVTCRYRRRIVQLLYVSCEPVGRNSSAIPGRGRASSVRTTVAYFLLCHDGSPSCPVSLCSSSILFLTPFFEQGPATPP